MMKGFSTMYLVGFGEMTRRAFVYEANVLDAEDVRVDVLDAAYDGKRTTVRGFTEAMLMRGRGVTHLPCYAAFSLPQDARDYAYRLDLMAEQHTHRHLDIVFRDWSHVGPKTRKDMTRGLWTIWDDQFPDDYCRARYDEELLASRS